MSAFEEPPGTGGDVVSAPVVEPTPEARCLDAVNDYLAHRGIGPTMGEVPMATRMEWRAIFAEEPDLDTETAYHWAWMNFELGVAGMRYRSTEPDCTDEANIAAYTEARSVFQALADDPTLPRLERARAAMAGASVDIHFAALTDNQNLQKFANRVQDHTVDALKAAISLYGKDPSPTLRGYINTLAAMSTFNISFARGGQKEVFAALSPSRYEAGTDAPHSDAPFVLWLANEDGYVLARVGQRATDRRVSLDADLLNNSGYPRTVGHNLGLAQAAIDLRSSSGRTSEAGRAFINQTLPRIRVAVRQSLERTSRERPDPETAPPGEWYGAHRPGEDVQDTAALEAYIQRMGPRQHAGELTTGESMMLASMLVEHGRAAGLATRAMLAGRLFEAAVPVYQEAGQLSRSFEASVAAAAAPVYAALAAGTVSPEIVSTYRGELVETARLMLEWRSEALEPAQAAELDILLQEITTSLLLLAEGGSHLPLPSLPRERGEYGASEDVRRWRLSVHIVDNAGGFSAARVARVRMGQKPHDRTLDNAVFTFSAGHLRAAPGRHPMLQGLIAEAHGGGFPTELQTARTRAMAELERGLTVVHLV